jgi:hypothetical protein
MLAAMAGSLTLLLAGTASADHYVGDHWWRDGARGIPVYGHVDLGMSPYVESQVGAARVRWTWIVVRTSIRVRIDKSDLGVVVTIGPP